MTNLLPFTCFKCRCTFKREFKKEVFLRKCPTCESDALMMDIRFRPPKRRDDKQWKKIEFLVLHGFLFQKIYRKEGAVWHRAKYPSTLEQAKEFVVQYKDQAFEIGI